MVLFFLCCILVDSASRVHAQGNTAPGVTNDPEATGCLHLVEVKTMAICEKTMAICQDWRDLQGISRIRHRTVLSCGLIGKVI